MATHGTLAAAGALLSGLGLTRPHGFRRTLRPASGRQPGTVGTKMNTRNALGYTAKQTASIENALRQPLAAPAGQVRRPLAAGQPGLAEAMSRAMLAGGGRLRVFDKGQS